MTGAPARFSEQPVILRPDLIKHFAGDVAMAYFTQRVKDHGGLAEWVTFTRAELAALTYMPEDVASDLLDRALRTGYITARPSQPGTVCVHLVVSE